MGRRWLIGRRKRTFVIRGGGGVSSNSQESERACVQIEESKQKQKFVQVMAIEATNRNSVIKNV